MSIALPDRLAPKRRLWTPRLVATLALFVISAAFFCAIVGNALVHQVDERQGLERREDGASVGPLGCRHVQDDGIERDDERTTCDEQ